MLSPTAGLGCHPFHITAVGGLRQFADAGAAGDAHVYAALLQVGQNTAPITGQVFGHTPPCGTIAETTA
jgi:hypothetical protein